MDRTQRVRARRFFSPSLLANMWDSWDSGCLGWLFATDAPPYRRQWDVRGVTDNPTLDVVDAATQAGECGLPAQSCSQSPAEAVPSWVPRFVAVCRHLGVDASQTCRTTALITVFAIWKSLQSE